MQQASAVGSADELSAAPAAGGSFHSTFVTCDSTASFVNEQIVGITFLFLSSILNYIRDGIM